MFVVLALLLSAAVPADNGGPAGDELVQLQGVWQTDLKRGDETLRIQVENRGNRQTLRTYREGQLTHEHIVEFELSRAGGAKVFRWKNGENTFGPRKGKPMPDGAFIYRLKDGRWTTISGFLDGEEDQPIISQQFQKIGQ